MFVNNSNKGAILGRCL